MSAVPRSNGETGTTGRSSRRGAVAAATAVTAPPAPRACVRRVWRQLEKMENLTDSGLRLALSNKMSSTVEAGYVSSPPGREHYALLEWLGNQWPGKSLIDMGTYLGASAISLAASGNSPVRSVDCIDYVDNAFKGVAGVTFILDDVLDWLHVNADTVAECPLVFVDVSHDGWTEGQIYKILEQIGFQGILLLDDIYLNEAMRRFWTGINRPKLDLSRIGHHSGTGAVLFERSRR